MCLDHILSIMKILPRFSSGCRVFQRGAGDYGENAYQYGTTSHEKDTMSPAIIVYPDNLEDIQIAVKYAKKHDLGVAVRTGGHQYSGASSTHGNNIQLDMSDTFEKDEDFSYNSETKILRVGISFSLYQLNERLRDIKCFIPHGQCSHVHLGGHVQTGGHGQMLRSHGLLSDHVEGFEIVLANGKLETVWRPNTNHEASTTLNDDLFFAVLGGSPGNFGVLTHVYIRPLHDEDYPDSRGMKLFVKYTKDKLENLLQICADMSDDKNCPRDFDYCITVMTNLYQGFYFKSLFEHFPNGKESLDETMMLYHGKEYGDGVDSAVDEKLVYPSEVAVPVILVYFQWANVDGEKKKFGPCEKAYFERIRDACSPNFLDSLVKFDDYGHKISNFVRKLLGGESKSEYIYLDYTKPTPMSQLARYWVFEDVREYVLPYEKRAFFSEKLNLSKNGWVQWTTKQIDDIASGAFDKEKSLRLCVQIRPLGGKYSMYRQNAKDHPDEMSFSWRDTFTMEQVMDCFYDPRDPDAVKKAMAWQQVNDNQAGHPLGIISEYDRRELWGSYARQDDPDYGANLYSVRNKYYDSEEKYQRLVRIKNTVDPDYVFTANAFGIDANNASKDKQLPIKGLDH